MFRAPAPGLVRLDNLVQVESGSKRIAYRSPGPPTTGEPARRDRSRVMPLPIASRRCNGAVREMNLPAEYTTSVSGRGRELQRTFNRVFMGFFAFHSFSCT